MVREQDLARHGAGAATEELTREELDHGIRFAWRRINEIEISIRGLDELRDKVCSLTGIEISRMESIVEIVWILCDESRFAHWRVC